MKAISDGRILAATVFGLLVGLSAGSAHADCAADGATAPIDDGDDVITCDSAPADDTDGVDAQGGDDEIAVDAGSSVSNAGGDAVVGGTGADTVVNNGSISGSGLNNGGVNDIGGDADIDNTLTGSIETDGFNADGIYVTGGGNSIVNDGGIVTTGNGAKGVAAAAGAEDGVANSGSIQTTGDGSIGVSTVGNNDVVNNTDTGVIETQGSDADGIRRQGDGAGFPVPGVTLFRVNNDGEITTGGVDADGIATLGDEHAISNDGTIATTGASGGVSGPDGGAGRLFGAQGIEILGDGNLVENSGDIDTGGGFADGIGTAGLGNGVVNTGNGTIATAGQNAHGIHLQGGSGEVDNDGGIETTGAGSHGIFTQGDNTVVDNDGGITTGGAGSIGIRAAGDDVRVSNSGTSITTSGADADGIRVTGDSAIADPSVDNTGLIETDGIDADGVSIIGNGHLILNSGTIDTNGGTPGGGGPDGTAGRVIGSQGVEVVGSGNEVSNAGVIDTTGASNGGSAIVATGGDNTIFNSGTIMTDGPGATGIRALGDDNEVVNGGTIQVTAPSASVSISGIVAGFGTAGDPGQDNRVINTSTGSITTGEAGVADQVEDANAITLLEFGNSPTFGAGVPSVDNAGALTTHGDDSDGIAVVGNGHLIRNSGEIVTNGDAGTIDSVLIPSRLAGAQGIEIVGDGNTVDNSGDIDTSGDDALGIGVRGNDNQLANSGTSITTSGTDADGIRLTGDSTMADPSVDNTGLIETTGDDADGIVIIGSDHLIQNNGEIDTAGGPVGVGGGGDADGGRIAGAQGIEVVGTGNTAVNQSGGSVTTAGVFASGIETDGGDNAVSNAGQIDTGSSFASGILVNGSGNTIGNQTTGIISTGGAFANGIETTTGNDSITNAGQIDTGGAFANGILVGGGGNTVANQMGGTITTTGAFANGIETDIGGNIIANDGEITTIGDSAIGILADGDDNQVANSGTSITTSGLEADGIRISGDSTTAAPSVANTGDISTSGDDADGISVAGGGHLVVNEGAVVTTGDGFGPGGDAGSGLVTGSQGIEVVGDANVIRNAGTVDTAGDGGYGVVTDGDANEVENDGAIATGGANAHGLFVQGTNGLVTNGAGGTVETAGDNASAVLAFDGDDTVSNAGGIATTGTGSEGIQIQGGGSTVMNQAGGTIVTAGDNAAGIQAFDGGNAVVNAGDVVTTGAGAHGIAVHGVGDTVVNAADGAIAVDAAAGGACVDASGASGTTLSSAGRLDCAGGDAAVLGADNDSVTLAANSTTVGNIDLGGGDDAVVLDTAAGTAGQMTGDILAAESLTKTGTGTFALIGAAEVGTTSADVDAGVLSLNDGIVIGNTNVNAAGTLRTANYAFDGDVANNGVLESTAGVLNISGDFVQGAGGSLVLTSNVAGTNSTRIDAGGTASLDGAVDVTVTDPENLVLGFNDILLLEAAGGRSGEFASESDNVDMLSSRVSSEVIYNPDQALLRVTLAPDAASLLGFGEAAAQASAQVGRVLDRRLRVLRNARRAGDASSVTAGTHSLALAGPLPAAVSPRHGYDPARTGAWGEFYADRAERDPANGQAGFRADTTGGMLGYDHAFGGLTAGVAGGYGQTSLDAGDADGFIDSAFAAAYAGAEVGAGYVEGTAHWADQDHETNRRTLGGDIAESDHDGEAYGLRLAAGVDLAPDVTVFDQLAYDRVEEDAYTETGAPGFNQTVMPADTDGLRNRLGLRFGGVASADSVSVIYPWLELAWTHDFDVDDPRTAARPAGAPGPAVVVERDDIDEDGIEARAGVAALLRNGFTLSAQAHGERRSDFDAYGVGLQVGYSFD